MAKLKTNRDGIKISKVFEKLKDKHGITNRVFSNYTDVQRRSGTRKYKYAMENGYVFKKEFRHKLFKKLSKQGFDVVSVMNYPYSHHGNKLIIEVANVEFTNKPINHNPNL